MNHPEHTWWVPVDVSPSTNPELAKGQPDIWIPWNVSTVELAMNTSQLILINPEVSGEKNDQIKRRKNEFLELTH